MLWWSGTRDSRDFNHCPESYSNRLNKKDQSIYQAIILALHTGLAAGDLLQLPSPP